MTLATDEFIRRFLIHVLPKGFHRIRHFMMSKSKQAYGFFEANIKVADINGINNAF
jgi:hypothetical protein